MSRPRCPAPIVGHASPIAPDSRPRRMSPMGATYRLTTTGLPRGQDHRGRVLRPRRRHRGHRRPNNDDDPCTAPRRSAHQNVTRTRAIAEEAVACPRPPSSRSHNADALGPHPGRDRRCGGRCGESGRIWSVSPHRRPHRCQRLSSPTSHVSHARRVREGDPPPS
jgi:hypothetical protein